MGFRRYYIFIFFCFFIFSTVLTAQNNKSEGRVEDIQSFCSNLKGFNLLGKFDVSWSNRGFNEKEFQVIQDLGFNFVRLPIDYRTYTLTQNWNYFVESRLKNIDDAVAWGEKYNVHVCINLHRAPGYCVNPTDNLPANQQLDLWTDTLAQSVFVNHWEFFANRYKNISPEKLSFNLVNEPHDVSEETYVQIMKQAITAIHEITPERIIFVDGLNYGGGTLLSLKDHANIAQAIHCYQPFQLTHYKAGWVDGSDSWQVPRWPVLMVNNYLFGPWKNEYKSPLIFKGNFTSGTEIIVNVNRVSIISQLQIKADNKIIFTKNFVCGADPGEDFTIVENTQWGYQNISNKDFSVTLSDSASSLSFENAEGDWMTINSISLVEGADTAAYFLSDNSWGEKQDTYRIDETKNIKTEDGENVLPFQEYQNTFTLALENNIPFMVQEFGVFNKTPYKVTIDFLSDIVDFFRENNVGWALWNLEGSFGILNSGRSDCDYELYQGFQLDRPMYEILKSSPATTQKKFEFIKSNRLYPSPAKNELFFSNNSLNGKTTIQIRDVLGFLVKSVEVQSYKNEIIKLDVSDLKSNIYFVSVQSGGKYFTEKILIHK